MSHILGDGGTLKGRAPVSRAVIKDIIRCHALHEIAVFLYSLVAFCEDILIAVVDIDIIRNIYQCARPVGSHQPVVAPSRGGTTQGI